MKKKNLIVHAIAVAIILATIVYFFQEANFQKEATEQNLHGFEAFSLIPAMGILVVFLEIFFGVLVIRFVYAMVVLIIKATKEQRELDRDFLQQTK